MSLAPIELMRYALSAAYHSTRAVRPNPRVGCAIETANGELVSAAHERVGEAHAERRALDLCAAKNLDPRGARVAVTLEPCSHQGRTGPCADALIAAGVSEVFVAMEDPFVQVRGRGIAKLRAAGIQVHVGLLSEKAEALNREWLFAQRNGRAHLTLKMATSWDGGWRSASGASKWITSEEARIKAQELRRRVDAIVTGGATVRTDNPRLTARNVDGSDADFQPKVIVLSQDPQAFDLGKLELAKHAGGVNFRSMKSPISFLEECHAQGLNDVMLECGPGLAQIFLESGVVDEIWSFQEAQVLGGGGSLGFSRAFAGGNLPGLRFEILETEQLGATSLLSILKPFSA